MSEVSSATGPDQPSQYEDALSTSRSTSARCMSGGRPTLVGTSPNFGSLAGRGSVKGELDVMENKE
eukprot:11650461-Heterocapsa_arctica.AAC.1